MGLGERGEVRRGRGAYYPAKLMRGAWAKDGRGGEEGDMRVWFRM